jgi:hypothetical protein
MERRAKPKTPSTFAHHIPPASKKLPLCNKTTLSRPHKGFQQLSELGNSSRSRKSPDGATGTLYGKISRVITLDSKVLVTDAQQKYHLHDKDTMPPPSAPLTPGLASFLKSLKTNPIDTSIDNLISCVELSLMNLPRYSTDAQKDCSNEDRSDTLDHARPQLPTSSVASSPPAGRAMPPNSLSGFKAWADG